MDPDHLKRMRDILKEERPEGAGGSWHDPITSWLEGIIGK